MSVFYNVINNNYINLCKRSERYPRLKVEFLDYTEKVIGEITSEISSNNEGNITISYNQGVRRKCSFSIVDTNGNYLPNENSPFWYHRKFKLWRGLWDIDSGNTYWFSQGVFFTTGVSVDNNILNIDGCDKFGLLSSDGGNACLEGDYVIDAGTNIYNAIIDTLRLDNGNKKPLDPISPILDIQLNTVTVPYDITTTAGSYIGDILIELAMCLGADIYYDTNGCLRIEKGTVDYFYSTKAPVWEFGNGEIEYISSTLNYNFQQVVNKITVCGDNTEGEIYSYTAENHNPSSPTRIELIGYRNGETIITPAGFSRQSCKDYAEYWLEQKTMLQLSVDIIVPIMPHFDVDKVILLTENDYKFDKQRLVITEINMPLGTSPMSINVCNVMNLPYYEELN